MSKISKVFLIRIRIRSIDLFTISENYLDCLCLFFFLLLLFDSKKQIRQKLVFPLHLRRSRGFMVEAFFFFFLSIKRVFPRFRREPTTNTERGKKKKKRKGRTNMTWYRSYRRIEWTKRSRISDSTQSNGFVVGHWSFFQVRAKVLDRSRVRVLALVDANTRGCPSASIARPSALIFRVCAITRHPFPSGR